MWTRLELMSFDLFAEWQYGVNEESMMSDTDARSNMGPSHLTFQPLLNRRELVNIQGTCIGL